MELMAGWGWGKAKEVFPKGADLGGILGGC